jgi:hypothetical protein
VIVRNSSTLRNDINVEKSDRNSNTTVAASQATPM